MTKPGKSASLFTTGRLIALFAVVGVAAVLYVMFSAAVYLSGAEGCEARGAVPGFKCASAPTRAPAALFKTETGEEISLAAFQGEYVLLNIWATWCAPCVAEMPALNALQRELGADGFSVVAVSIDREGAAHARRFLERHGAGGLGVYADPSMQFAFSVGGANRLPLSILIGPDGYEIGRVYGAVEWDGPKVVSYLTGLLSAE